MHPTFCNCRKCLVDRDERIHGIPAHISVMVVCPTCGDKRCPHAEDHRNPCQIHHPFHKRGTMRHCCVIGCGKPAEFQIEGHPLRSPDDWTDACRDHVGELLDDASAHIVYPIAE